MRAWLIALAGIWALALPLAAEPRAYLQVEAQPSRAQAEAAAARYAAAFDAVVGYALGTGWYAIALGPFPDRAAAAVVGRELRAAGRVPSDAFVVEAARTAARFWPDDTSPPAPQAATDPAPGLSETLDPPPDQSPAEARRSEATLDRDARAELQSALAWFGHYDLSIDAAFGPATRRAMADWQAAQGADPTGVLTSAQRTRLLAAWQADRARYGFAPWQDADTGIEVTLPKALVAFDRREPPFLRFAPREGSGVEILLISQEGTPASLAALRELMGTLEAMPSGETGELTPDRFTLAGRDARGRTHAEAQLTGDQIRGFVLIWPADQPGSFDRTLDRMQASLRATGPALGGLGATPSAVTGADLVAGLALRRPARTLTGFFIDAAGRVLTSAALAEGCARLTIEGRHDARIALQDPDLGVAVLVPAEPLAPAAHARFANTSPALRSDVVLAGFALPEMTAPVLTTGRLAALEGLGGEPFLRRLDLHPEPAESGGPVMDRTGTVLGMLLPPAPPGTATGGRLMPDGISFAVGAEAILALLGENGLAPTRTDPAPATPIDLPTLARTAARMTVQVDCWP